MDRDEILRKLREYKIDSGGKHRVSELGVFGSVARGEDQEDSDVDTVFETDEPNLFRTARLKLELEALLSRPVDIVRLRGGMNPRLKERILAEARFV